MNQRKMGVVLSYASMLINIAVGLITVPLMTHFMGTSEYGLYELMGSLIAYMSVMDFGLSATITRYYSQAIARGDERAKQNILALSGLIYLAVAVLTVFVGAVLYQAIGPVYSAKLTPAELLSCKRIFIVLIVNMTITIPSNLFVAVLTSEERFVFLRGVTMFSQALQPVMYVIVLCFVPTAFAVCVIQTVFNLAVVALNAFHCFAHVHMKIRLYSFDRLLVREMLGFAFFIFLNTVIDQLYWKTDILILGAVVGTAATGIYGIASRINTMYINFSSTVNSVFLPQISRIVTTSGSMEPVNAIMKKVGRIQFLVMSLILSGFICYGKRFLWLWAGSNYTDAQKAEAYYICLIVMVPILIPLIQNIGISILQAMNKHAFRSVVYFAIAIANVAASIPLAQRFGGLGCAVATSGAMIIGNIIIINIYYVKVIHLDVLGFAAEIARLLPVMLVMIGYGVLSNWLLPGGGWLLLGAKILLYAALFFALSWKFSMNDYEKQLVAGPVRKLWKRRG
ncbi:MAG: oligosaccharide flippase family protein [Eubacteriales bacterium]|nr:oligosaccharide flippase family protein [Eubacteriales bacterium]